MPSLSEQERRDLALTIAGEIDPRLTTYGTPESAQEMAAILGTIENRRALGFFKYGNYSDVVKEKKQYSTWNTEEKRKIAEQNYGLFKKHIDRAVDAFAGGYLKSPVPDATHYWAPKAMLALTGSPEPYWAPDIVDRKAVGAHIFGEDPDKAERLPHARDWVRSPPIPTIKPSQTGGIPGHYAYAGVTRLSAPAEPVSDGRTIAEKQQDRLTMAPAGVLGLDGRQAIEHGVPPFERGTLRSGRASFPSAERWAAAEPARTARIAALASDEIPVPTSGGGDYDSTATGPAAGVDFELRGKNRPEMPDQSIVDIVRDAVDYVYGRDYRVEVYSGKGIYGSNRHPTGKAVDFRIYTPDGRLLNARDDRAGYLAVAQAAHARGALGAGLGTNYMKGRGIHLDQVQPNFKKGQDHEWGNIGDANAGLLAEARARGVMPLPERMVPPPSRASGPGSTAPLQAAPVDPVVRRNLPPPASVALSPERGWHQAAVAGLTPVSKSALPLPKSAPAATGRAAPILPARPITPTPAAALPFAPGAVKRFPAAPTAPLVTRSINEPIRRESKGQPGGSHAGSGLSATSAVRSGTTPVGTIAHSRSDPSVSLASLPGGRVAHVNDKHGFISTWSPADDDELGTTYGKTLAIDPAGSKYGYFSPGKVPTGWATYSPGKGFSKSFAQPSNARSYGPGLFGLFGNKPGSLWPASPAPRLEASFRASLAAGAWLRANRSASRP